MKGYKLPKDKHLTPPAREEIQNCLDMGVSFKDIAHRVGKSPTTISREVKKHLTFKEAPTKCKKSDGTPIDLKPCPKLMKAPFVCNPCENKRRHCPYRKQFYYAKAAQNEYKYLLKDAREGIPLNKQEFYDADAIISKGIKKGQRLYHIIKTYDVDISMSSAYRYLHKDYLSINKLDLPRVVKFKVRKQYRVAGVPKAAKIGRTYDDFKAYIDEHEIRHWVEMDTVIGRVGGKVIMTFDFTQMNFMFGLLLDDKTALETTEKIKSLKAKLLLCDISFGDICPLLLTDNGGEFSNVLAFTQNTNGEIETELYFCDPYRSCQKPRVEKNHTIFRDIVPKGESFDDFTQDMVDLIFSHVNGGKRKILNGKSPYELFVYIYGEKTASLLGIKYIPPEEVIQTKKLLIDLKKSPPSNTRHTTSDDEGGDLNE